MLKIDNIFVLLHRAVYFLYFKLLTFAVPSLRRLISRRQLIIFRLLFLIRTIDEKISVIFFFIFPMEISSPINMVLEHEILKFFGGSQNVSTKKTLDKFMAHFTCSKIALMSTQF